MQHNRDFIDITPYESIGERFQSVGWSGLTDAEREIGAVYMFNGTFIRMGLKELNKDFDHSRLNAAIGGFVRLGAHREASLLAQIIEGDTQDLDAIQEQLGESKIWDLRFTFPDAYVEAHPDEFPGPRSLSEIWESMQRRGVKEKPARLAKMERHHAADALHTKRRCKVCGQAVPEHKSACRRCNRPYAD